MKYTLIDGENGAVTVRIEGQLDAITVSDIRPLFDQLTERRPRMVTLDLSALRLIDSSGVGAIVSLFKRVRSDNGDFHVRGASGQPLAIFKLLRLDRVFSL
ncbi:MAG TPA: STAS domain-containing protein [Polyangia bacterium]|jgi:anti-sigma B factor antagonist|nr:STAS domain-containing protein [Polyangia bacterium]